jgi:hypothetical protein
VFVDRKVGKTYLRLSHELEADEELAHARRPEERRVQVEVDLRVVGLAFGRFSSGPARGGGPEKEVVSLSF